MNRDSFSTSPFVSFFPVSWEMYADEPPVSSLTHTHGLRTKFLLHNLNDELNQDREPHKKTLISYVVNRRRYDLYTLDNLNQASYAFDETGFSNMKGDLAERVARRLMKRFLQTFDAGKGRLGGLFDKRFNPKKKRDYMVSHTEEYVLKIGSYPNMILLKRTGHGHWGYQHVTDLDGLFDFRYLGRRNLVIMESKIGKIDINPDSLYQTLFKPLKKLFPDANFTYVVFAGRDHLFHPRNPEYRVLQDTPTRIFEGLKSQGIPCLFFEFSETDGEFNGMCRHLITCARTYNSQRVTFQGEVQVSDEEILIYNPGSHTPYLKLQRDLASGAFQVIHSARPIVVNSDAG